MSDFSLLFQGMDGVMAANITGMTLKRRWTEGCPLPMANAAVVRGTI